MNGALSQPRPLFGRGVIIEPSAERRVKPKIDQAPEGRHRDAGPAHRNRGNANRRTYAARLLKNCTAFSCFIAFSRVENVPRFRLLPVFGSIFREYRRYPPDFNLRIMMCSCSFGCPRTSERIWTSEKSKNIGP